MENQTTKSTARASSAQEGLKSSPKTGISLGLGGTVIPSPHMEVLPRPCLDGCWLGQECGQESWQMKASPMPAARDSTSGGFPHTCWSIHQPFPCITPAAGGCEAGKNGGGTADSSGAGRLRKEELGSGWTKPSAASLWGRKQMKAGTSPRGVQAWEQVIITAQGLGEQTTGFRQRSLRVRN